MTPWKTSEIARRLAERDDVEPPEGLLEKIKSDIPAELPMVPTLPRVPEIGPRPTPPKRRVWLMAASLAAAVCGGALGLWMMQNAEIKKQAMEETARQQVPAPAPAPAPAVPAPAPAPASPEAAPAPAAKEKAAADLKALGDVRGEGGVPAAPKPIPPPAPAPPPPPAKTAPPRDEPLSVQAESKAVPAPEPAEVPAGVVGGVVGGVAGGSPVEEKDERRADQDKEEMKKGRAPQEAQSSLQKTPAAKTDRISAGGNEAGKRQLSAGAAAQPRREVSGDAMMRQSRQSLAEGRLPSPETVRVEDFVSAYSPAARGFLARSRAAIQADGAPAPFTAEEGSHLLRVTVPAAHDATVRVDFNPAVVTSWRRLGTDRSQATAATRGDSVTAGITVLYAVTLKPETQPSQTILTLHLGQTAQDLHLGALPPSWEKAAPDLRLVSLAAQLAEVLRGSPWAQSTDLDDLVRRAHRVAADLAGTPRAAAAADLVKMAEEVARLKR
ncbi:MAG TPA: hypothetical protein VH988_28080 [Thermoanaerobaculia bacterium]|jgi:hypothetical protein|nr:hypothetical protein [Thermoanaerobaculia bacterium]